MLDNVLIQHGHVEDASELADTPDLEGFLASNRGEAVRLSNDVDLDALKMHLPKLKTILVDFPAYADGRGFSIARQLRKVYGFKGKLIADGPLVPDQYNMARQCGFDGVRVDGKTFSRQSESDWFNAMDAFKSTYQRGYALKNGPATSVFDARKTALAARGNDDPYFGYSAERALEQALSDYEGKIVLASSLGVDSVVLLHMVAQIDKNVPIIFLDTGKHFRETLTYRDMIVEDLGLTDFRNITPDFETVKSEDADGQLYSTDPDACCNLRKVRPLDSVISGFEARITGRKRYQTPQRKDMPMLEVGGRQAKVNPLAYWHAKDVTGYMRKHDLPPHPLLALGFLSVGCQPCTTRVADGEDARAGRWRNHEKTECGIHYIDGKWVPVPDKKTYEVF
ncbi:MAG: phosphoadenylyl-sulfate reductase [Maricaulaceae bacterium]